VIQSLTVKNMPLIHLQHVLYECVLIFMKMLSQSSGDTQLTNSGLNRCVSRCCACHLKSVTCRSVSTVTVFMVPSDYRWSNSDATCDCQIGKESKLDLWSLTSVLHLLIYEMELQKRLKL